MQTARKGGLATKLGDTGFDGAIKRRPMGLSQAFRNDQIEAVTDCLIRSKAENRFGRSIPLADYTFGIGKDDRIRGLLDDGVGELRI